MTKKIAQKGEALHGHICGKTARSRQTICTKFRVLTLSVTVRVRTMLVRTHSGAHEPPCMVPSFNTAL